MKICAIIPSYHHTKAIAGIIAQLREAGLYVYVVDDGNDEPEASALNLLHKPKENVFVLRLPQNQGKGAAVVAGMKLALQNGFTHALQVDADGQHDLSCLNEFIVLGQKYPHALICGKPLYDASVPMGRKVGRWITHVWVWIETLSFRISDSMCGFRLYPLSEVEKLLVDERIGSRMDFDTDIIVRLFWRGVAPIMRPVKVTYPVENYSNFDLWQDNWRITKMHTRLCLTLLRQFPIILLNRPKQVECNKEWATLSERGVYLGIKFCALLCLLLGRLGRKLLLSPIVLYFYLTGSVQRKASRDFLKTVVGEEPSFKQSFTHFMNFAMRAVDVFMAWAGKLPPSLLRITNDDVLDLLKNDKRGGVIVISHLGNVEVVRALVDTETRKRLTVLVHTKHAVNYNRIVCEGCGEAADNVLQVTDVGPETIINLKERVENGGWIVIAGDRTPVQGKANTSFVSFFGKQAALPQGPWVLASLLGCPVYLMFCMMEKETYTLTLEPFCDKVLLKRGERDKTVKKYVQDFANRLEVFCRKDPYQWYNFYDFWSAE